MNATPLNPDDMKMSIPVAILDEDKIRAGMRVVLDAWQAHINARTDAGETVPYWEGLMMLQNAYKAALDHVILESGASRVDAAMVYRTARATFDDSMDQRIRSGPPQ